MDTAKQAGQALASAEQRLRELVGAAAASGDYAAAERIMAWARALADLTAECATPEGSTKVARGQSVAAGATPGNGRPQKNTPLSLPGRGAGVRGKARRTPPKGEYPRFFRRGDFLVKIGWSKKERQEYEHKAPRRVIDALAAAIARQAGNGKLFTAEELFPLKDPQDGSEVPGYQAYVALAWLKATGLVKAHGRRGYTTKVGAHVPNSVPTAWQSVSDGRT